MRELRSNKFLNTHQDQTVDKQGEIHRADDYGGKRGRARRLLRSICSLINQNSSSLVDQLCVRHYFSICNCDELRARNR